MGGQGREVEPEDRRQHRAVALDGRHTEAREDFNQQRKSATLERVGRDTE